VSRLRGTASWQRRIFDVWKMSERTRPEFHWQTSANQHRPDCLVHPLVSTFNKPILMTCSSAHDSHLATKRLLKQIPDCFGHVQLSSLIHEDALIFHVVLHVLREPLLQPRHRRCLRMSAHSVQPHLLHDRAPTDNMFSCGHPCNH